VSLPRITVITPSLNQVDYLERTIRSVLDQGYTNLEYIVVDGGSTDGSVEILERHSAHLARWVSEPDGGQAEAINKGISWATGDIVGYINSDDYYLPGAFDAVAAAMQDARVRWCVGQCRYLHDDGRLERLYRPQPPSMPPRTMIRETWYVPQASSFWRNDVFTQVGPLRTDLHYVFDLEFGLRCALTGITPLCIENELAVRFLHQEAKSATPQRFTDEYAAVGPELERTFLRRGDVIRDVAYRAKRRARRVALGGRP
jgi:glycosyltransferase involved in cell wall biosynthesis